MYYSTTVFNTSMKVHSVLKWQSTCTVNFYSLVYVQVFVCGPYPHWIFLSGRGGMYIHPMYIDGPIASFASFHNVNCPHGFLYFNTEVCVCCTVEMRITLCDFLPLDRVNFVSVSSLFTCPMTPIGQ